MVSNSTFLVTSATSSFRIVGLVVASTVVEGSVTQLLLDTIYCQDREDVMVAEAVDPSSGSCILLQTIMVEDRATLLIRRISSISIGAFRAVQFTACTTHNATLRVAEASTITFARQPMTAGITVYTVRPIILVNCIFNNTNVTLLDRSVAVSLANLTLNVSLALLLNTTLTESTLAVSDVILPVHRCNDTAAFAPAELHRRWGLGRIPTHKGQGTAACGVYVTIDGRWEHTDISHWTFRTECDRDIMG